MITRRRLIGLGMMAVGAESAANFLKLNSGLGKFHWLGGTDKEFEVFLHPFAREDGTGFRGGEASIAINLQKQLVRKRFALNAITSSGHPPRHTSEEDLSRYYHREKACLQKLNQLGSEHAPRLVAFDDATQTLTLPYLGPDLCVRMIRDGWRPSNHHLQQIAQMYDEFRQAGFLYRNASRPNFYWNPETDKMIASDFRSAKARVLSDFVFEVHQIHLYLPTIHPRLPGMLRETFSDFPEKVVALAFDTAAQFTWDDKSRFDRELRRAREAHLIGELSRVVGERFPIIS